MDKFILVGTSIFAFRLNLVCQFCQKRIMEISFTGNHGINTQNFGINFQAKVDGENFICSVTTAALQDVDPSNAQRAPEQQFLANRSTFESIARKKILGGATSPLLITSTDVLV